MKVRLETDVQTKDEVLAERIRISGRLRIGSGVLGEGQQVLALEEDACVAEVQRTDHVGGKRVAEDDVLQAEVGTVLHVPVGGLVFIVLVA